MKNNRGFTLVELLAVIVILLTLSLTTSWGITSVLENHEEKECQEQQQLAIGAAKIYFSLNDVNEVSIETLKANNYFANNKKLDRLNESDIIKLNSTKTDYEYLGTTCESS